jgi:hypothetical protein
VDEIFALARWAGLDCAAAVDFVLHWAENVFFGAMFRSFDDIFRFLNAILGVVFRHKRKAL